MLNQLKKDTEKKMEMFYFQNNNAMLEANKGIDAKIKNEKQIIMEYLKKFGIGLIIVNIIGVIIALFMSYNCKGFNIFHIIIACIFWVFYIPYRLFGKCTKNNK